MLVLNLINLNLCRWIVWTIFPESNSLDLLETMMTAVNSYYHPTSEGRYSEKLVDLLSRLIHTFCSRLHRERHQDEREGVSWVPRHPEESYLTDQQILKIVKPALMDLTMSKRYIVSKLNFLCMLDSVIDCNVIPGILRPQGSVCPSCPASDRTSSSPGS